MKFETALLHGSYAPDVHTGSTLPPLWQSTSFAAKTAEELEEIFAGRKPGYLYSRVANPTVTSFERRIAALEGGQGAIACNSGMAAISVALLNFLQPGDEIVSSSGIFGGTIDLFADFEDFGIHSVYVNGGRAVDFEAAITEKTAAVFVESIGNPKLDVPNIKELAALCDVHGLPLIVDSTMATPYLYQPLSLGAALVIHSTSKFINGSASAIGGIIVAGSSFNWNSGRFKSLLLYKKFGSLSYIAKLRKTVYRNGGVCMPPLHAWLNSIGLETLSVRMERMCENALLLAKALQNDPNVAQVNYPGLESHTDYETAKEQFDGRFGAMLTLRAGSRKKAFLVINSLRYATNVSNIGDVRTLVLHPASTIFAEHSKEQCERAGVYDDLIRVSVGLENIGDLIEDFKTAFCRAQEECIGQT